MSTDQVAAAESQLLTKLMFFFRVVGWAGILIGLVHLMFIFIDSYAAIRLSDALINMFSGAIGLVCWRLLILRKRVVMAVWVGGVVAAVIYAFAVGRGLNVIVIVSGSLILGGLVVLSRRQELS
jgi:hypothetical protein